MAGSIEASHVGAPRRPFWTVDAAALQRGVLWAFVASGASASIEPSPYEFMFLFAALTLGATALRFHRVMVPMILLLALYNAGGMLALVPFVDQIKSVTFVAISSYVALTAVFFAGIVAKDPRSSMRTIRSGYVATGFAAAILGVLGYFDVAGLGEHFTLYDNLRATGPFKDPNVFGPFLVPPIVFVLQDVMLGRSAGHWRRMMLMLIMLLALLLTFSRGAWGALVLSTLLLAVLTFATTTSPRLRRRIVIVAVAGALLALLALSAALSIPSIGDVFVERASFSQEYDVGELGRFGSQLRSIPMLLERPFGFGPLRFETIFPSAPHNVYVNAFAAYGWLGGVSFFALTIVTVYVGFRTVFRRSLAQLDAIAVWSSLLPQMTQGFQIDTDHWRHLYLLLGCIYGLASAATIDEHEERNALTGAGRRSAGASRADGRRGERFGAIPL